MRGLRIICFLLLSSALSVLSFPSSIEEILNKNVQAVGGIKRLSSISNFSLKVGDFTFFVRKDGKMKVVKGKMQVCLEVLIVDDNNVRRNSIKGLNSVEGVERLTSIFQAKLISGIFTLSNFGKVLKYNGIKNFGIKKFYELETKIDGANVNLYIDQEDFLIKRGVISYLSPEKEKQEINYDFGPYFDYEGIKIPSSWFVSRVGARGILYEVEEIKLNEKIKENFFSETSLNIGDVMVSKGELKGNIIDFYERQGRTFIVTNWTAECFEKAGIGTGDTVNFRVLGKDFEFNFFKDIEEARKAGASQRGNILSKAPDSEFYILFIPGTFDLKENSQILLPIELRKK